jgi:hypothetical protein
MSNFIIIVATFYVVFIVASRMILKSIKEIDEKDPFDET